MKYFLLPIGFLIAAIFLVSPVSAIIDLELCAGDAEALQEDFAALGDELDDAQFEVRNIQGKIRFAARLINRDPDTAQGFIDDALFETDEVRGKLESSSLLLDDIEVQISDLQDCLSTEVIDSFGPFSIAAPETAAQLLADRLDERAASIAGFMATTETNLDDMEDTLLAVEILGISSFDVTSVSELREAARDASKARANLRRAVRTADRADSILEQLIDLITPEDN